MYDKDTYLTSTAAVQGFSRVQEDKNSRVINKGWNSQELSRPGVLRSTRSSKPLYAYPMSYI